MILTFLIDPPLLLFLGVLFACALPMTSSAPIGRSRAMIAGLIVLTIFNLAVAISYVQYPDWMWMYFVQASNWSSIGIGLSLLVGLLAYYLIFALGFYWGISRRAFSGKIPWALLGILLVLSGAAIVPVFDRYFHVGSYADFIAGTALELPTSPLAPVFNTAFPLMILAAIPLILWARKEK